MARILALLALFAAAAAAAPEQCSHFEQITGGVSHIVASPDDVFFYALPTDCPDVCTICSAGCLFCSSSGYVGSGVPDAALPYKPEGEGSWLALDTFAQGAGGACTPGGGVGATTGSLVSVDGMTGTYSTTTGTRVSSKTSSCGKWTLVDVAPLPPAPPGGYAPPPPLPSPPPPLPPALYDWQTPDAKLTPGDTNPDVNETWASMNVTICCNYRGRPDCQWSTSQYRPPASYTTNLKIEQLAGDYADFVKIWGGSTTAYEEDHLIPLELGGDGRSRLNLWPQPHASAAQGEHQSELKDRLEGEITRRVCAGEVGLRAAQQEIATHWPAAYAKYVQDEDIGR